MDINAVNQAIISGKFTNEQLDSITMAVRYARSQLGRINCRALRVGSSVSWHSSRRQTSMQGRVVKIGRKNVTVDCGTLGQWRVPANMLEVA
jgi:hypothetical protein